MSVPVNKLLVFTCNWYFVAPEALPHFTVKLVPGEVSAGVPSAVPLTKVQTEEGEPMPAEFLG